MIELSFLFLQSPGSGMLGSLTYEQSSPSMLFAHMHLKFPLPM